MTAAKSFVRARAALSLQETRDPALAFGKLRDGLGGLHVVRDCQIVPARLHVFSGARVEGSDQRAVRIRQRRQVLQHKQSLHDLVAVRGRQRSLAVVGQQADRVVEASLRLRAIGKIEQHGRVLEQSGLQLPHLRAEACGRRGRHIGFVIVGVRVVVTFLQDRIVESRDLLPVAWRHDAQPVAGPGLFRNGQEAAELAAGALEAGLDAARRLFAAKPVRYGYDDGFGHAASSPTDMGMGCGDVTGRAVICSCEASRLAAVHRHLPRGIVLWRGPGSTAPITIWKCPGRRPAPRRGEKINPSRISTIAEARP